jgi:hypothetical protein
LHLLLAHVFNDVRWNDVFHPFHHGIKIPPVPIRWPTGKSASRKKIAPLEERMSPLMYP